MGYEVSFLALVISLVYIGITGVYPGGIIVPSYLVLFFHYPQRIAGTLAAALLTLLCFKLASRYLVLFGRRRFVFMILVASLWSFLWLHFFPAVFPGSLEFRVIGWIIPGLIANSFERQGIVVTGASFVTVTVAVYVMARMFQMVA